MGGERNVIEANHSNIFWHTYTMLFGSRQDTVCHLIIADEKSTGLLVGTHRKDHVGTRAPARNFKTALQHELRMGNEVMIEQCLAKSLIAFVRAAIFSRTLNMGDASMAQADKMTRCLVGALVVVNTYPWNGCERSLVVDYDNG